MVISGLGRERSWFARLVKCLNCFLGLVKIHILLVYFDVSQILDVIVCYMLEHFNHVIFSSKKKIIMLYCGFNIFFVVNEFFIVDLFFQVN